MAADDVVVVTVVVVVLTLVLTINLYARRYKRVPMDQAMVVYGAKRGDRGYMIIGPGGGKFIVPIVEAYKFMSLQQHALRLAVRGAVSSSGELVPVNLVAVVGISSERVMLDRAASRLLSRGEGAVVELAENAVIEATRQSIKARDAAAVTGDLVGLSQAIREAAGAELAEWGIEVTSLTVRDFGEAGFPEPDPRPAMKAVLIR